MAAAGVGLGFGLSARADYDEYKTTDDATRFHEVEDSVPRKALVANISFAAAGALAVTSAVLFFLEGRPARGEGRAVSLVPTVGGAVVGGRF